MYNYVKVFTRFRCLPSAALMIITIIIIKTKILILLKNDISQNRDKNKKACLVLCFHGNDKCKVIMLLLLTKSNNDFYYLEFFPSFFCVFLFNNFLFIYNFSFSA